MSHLQKNVINTAPTNVTSTIPTNSDDKNVKNAILPFLIAIIFYHYAKDKSKQKKYWHSSNLRNRNKIMTTSFFDSIIMMRFGETKIEKKNFMM